MTVVPAAPPALNKTRRHGTGQEPRAPEERRDGLRGDQRRPRPLREVPEVRLFPLVLGFLHAGHGRGVHDLCWQ